MVCGSGGSHASSRHTATARPDIGGRTGDPCVASCIKNAHSRRRCSYYSPPPWNVLLLLLLLLLTPPSVLFSQLSPCFSPCSLPALALPLPLVILELDACPGICCAAAVSARRHRPAALCSRVAALRYTAARERGRLVLQFRACLAPC